MAEEASTEESVFNINIGRAMDVPVTRRAGTAVSEIRRFIVRHMKTDPADVWIDGHVSEYIWARGARNPPRMVTVKAVKFEDGLVEVSFPDEE